MARDGTIPTGKLVEMLMRLPIESRISANALGNLMCYGEDKYLGYIDTHTEKFHSIAEMAYEMLEREDEPEERAGLEQAPREENFQSNLRKVYRKRE